MNFGKEVIELINKRAFSYGEEHQRIDAEQREVAKVHESIRPLVAERNRLRNETKRLSGLVRQYPGELKNLVDAQLALQAAQAKIDKIKSPAELDALTKRGLQLQKRRGEIEKAQRLDDPLIRWNETVWQPFFEGWRLYHEQKTDVPAQTWPLSGTWDQIQDYRKQFIELRSKAPFEAQGPAPLDPRKDPSLTGGLVDLFKGLKWVGLGVLGIGGVLAVSAVASNIRKGSRK